jgi:hypothetical protein
MVMRINRAHGWLLPPPGADIGTLTAAEAEYVSSNHEYRNQLYRVGIAQEDVIHALASNYLRFGCSLVSRWQRLRLPIASSHTKVFPVALFSQSRA